jgi:hypothetical protein
MEHWRAAVEDDNHASAVAGKRIGCSIAEDFAERPRAMSRTGSDGTRTRDPRRDEAVAPDAFLRFAISHLYARCCAIQPREASP